MARLGKQTGYGGTLQYSLGTSRPIRKGESERERVKLLLGGDGLNVYTQVVPVGVCGKT